MRVFPAIALVAAGLTLAACGATPAGSAAGQPASPTPPGAAAATSAPASVAPAGTVPPLVQAGQARAVVNVGGEEFVITGGECRGAQYPAELGGTYFFGINIGTLNSAEGGPDYLGALIDTPQDPDGTYHLDFVDAAGTLVAGHHRIALRDIEATIRDDGGSATITGADPGTGAPVTIEVTCR